MAECLGKRYAFGVSVAKDYNEALKWFRMAADQGDAYGQFFTGMMNSQSIGVSQDYK